jgi:hypothetical protein
MTPYVSVAYLVVVGFITPAALATPNATSPSGPPAPGRYAGQLCVSTSGAPAQCGPVAVVSRHGKLRVQFSDLVYTLEHQVPKTQMRLVLMHSHVQIDEFLTQGEWLGRSLRFKDPDKDVRYEVRW